MKTKSAFIKNILYAFFAQGIALMLSVIMSLIVPKILGVEQYSYWQLFSFYASYVGFFHFGLTDGVYLRLGGSKYDELNYKELGGEMRVLFYAVMIVSSFVSLGIIFSDIVYERKYILLLTVFYLIISNLSVFLGYIFQAVNLTKVYSLSVILDRLLIIVCFAILISFKVTEFYLYVLYYSICKLSSLIYCIVKGREIVFAEKISFQSSFIQVKKDILAGINIMIANIAGNLILGVGRMVIDQRWGIESFGKFSFSLSLTNFFLLFISQISMVLFPALRQISKTKMKTAYIKMRFLVSVLLPCSFVIYIPMKFFLIKWLPFYEESLRYMILLLPICTFDGKMQLLCNTYLKVLREEKELLKTNMISLAVSVILCFASGYVFNSIVAVAISMVLSIAVRSIISEVYLSRLMDEKIIWRICGECILVIVFIVVHWNFSDGLALLMILFSYMIFLSVNYLNYRKMSGGILE